MFKKVSPDPALICPHHGRVFLAGERLLKFGHVGNDIIHPVFRDAVRVGKHDCPHVFGANLLTPRVGVGQKELLPWCPAIKANRSPPLSAVSSPWVKCPFCLTPASGISSVY